MEGTKDWSAARVASSELLIVGLMMNINNEVLGPPLVFQQLALFLVTTSSSG